MEQKVPSPKKPPRKLSETSLHSGHQFCRASLAPGPLENPQSPWFPWKLQKGLATRILRQRRSGRECSQGEGLPAALRDQAFRGRGPESRQALLHSEKRTQMVLELFGQHHDIVFPSNPSPSEKLPLICKLSQVVVWRQS